jgi:hypothetical protein
MEKTTPYKLDHKSEVIYCIGFKKWFNFHGWTLWNSCVLVDVDNL